MKRKMLISISLLVIMILNCILPLFVVNAAEGEEIRLNSKLYAAVRASLTQQGIKFTSNDITHAIAVEDITSVKKLNLNEGAISDLTGLDGFTALEHLELSGNTLSKDSHLGVLNNLTNLNYLDLSTNSLDNVDEISTLISELGRKGTIILSGQTVTQVQSVFVDTQEDSNNEEIAEFELPSILGLAGYVKSFWKSTSSTKETEGATAPYITLQDVPMYVNDETPNVKVHIASEDGYGYLGMAKLSIYIYDDATEAARANNVNRASENILNGSRFNLYYVVHADYSEAVTTMDSYLYRAIKDQLTGGQTINPDLVSYPYMVDENEETIYEEYFYDRTDDGNYLLYKEKDNGGQPVYEYIIDGETGIVSYYTEDGNGNPVAGDEYIRSGYEATTIKVVDADGRINLYEGFKLPARGDSTGRDLYIQAYDEAKTFVIYDTDLINKITSLILNNEQIRDLSGIENFIGLTSNLNVSHNYLSNIDPIYGLDENKDEWEAKLLEEYSYWLLSRKYGNLKSAKTSAEQHMAAIEGYEEKILKVTDVIINKLKESAQIERGTGENSEDAYNDKIDGKAAEINKEIDKVLGYTDDKGNYVKGYLELMQAAELSLRSDIAITYGYLEKLYTLYNNEYRITTLLSDSLNYMTTEEYENYVTATKTSRDTAYALLTEQISYLKNLEVKDAITSTDNAILSAVAGVTANAKDKTLAAHYDQLLKQPLDRVDIVNLLKGFREIGLYSEMASYCLIKRMNETTPSGYCYEEEYLKNRIKEFGYDDIPTDLEESVLEMIQSYEENPTGTQTTAAFNAYMAHKEARVYQAEGGDTQNVYSCTGEYIPVERIRTATVVYPLDELKAKAIENIDPSKVTSAIDDVAAKIYVKDGEIAVYKDILYYEDIDRNNTYYSSEEGQIFLYRQMMSLANKLVNGNLQRYIKLPRLKVLDVSYNAELDNLQGITRLAKTLSDLNASYCYIADVDNINWSEMTNMKRLNLAFNFISDMKPLSALKNLKYLNLSNNLLAGVLEITEQEYNTVYKKLQELDLSGNQLTDINSLMIYLDYIAGGHYPNYVAREDTIDINLRGQNIVIEIPEKISLTEYPTTIDIDLPPIFTQLLEIDTDRTAFGETSQRGRVESEGKYVTLNTRSTGAKEGTVVVIPMTGNGTTVDTCVGEGTTAKIYYNVVDGTTTDPTNPTDPTESPFEDVELGYTLKDTELINVKAKTPLAAFKSILLNNSDKYDVVVTRENEGPVTSGNVATGMLVKVVDKDGHEVAGKDGRPVVFEIVVKGDVNGDGLANSLDSVLIKAARNDVINLNDISGNAFDAADIDGNGSITINDSKLLLYHRAEVSGYSLNY